jgi:hypothetical protein
MTKSAKQDSTASPAKTAVAESAGVDATRDADAPQPSEVAAETAVGDDDKPGIDDVKAKFREALDRKRQAHAEGQGKGAHESGKVNGAHGPAASKRNFRRKSG